MSNDVEIRIKGATDFTQAKAQIAALKAQARDLAREKIRIDADVDAARAKIAGLRRELKEGTSGRTTVEVDADIAAAVAELEGLQRKAREVSRERASLNVDTGEATAKLAAFRGEADAAVDKVDGKTAHVNVDADVGAALAKIALVGAALAGLGVAGGAVGAALGLGAVAGAGLGAAVAGLSGIGGAVKALGEQTKGAGAAASHAAGQQLQMAGAVDRVRQAQAALANTRSTVADSERHAAEQAVRAAEDEQRADRRVADAQRDLNAARADAARQLRDLARQQEDMALQQRGAALDVEQAQAELDKTIADPAATDLQRRQAQLAYDEAIQHNADLKADADDLAARKADADRRGVAGSEQVAAATRAVADAQREARDAHLATAEAQKASVAAQRDGAYRIAQAQQAIVDAQRAVQQASVSAGAAGAAGMDKLGQAMAGLSPTAQAFARFLRGFLDGPIQQLRTAGQEGLLPGLQKGLESLTPIITANLPAFRAFATVVGQALGGVIQVAGTLAPPLMRMATVVLRALAPVQGVLIQFAAAFGKVIDQMTADGSMQAAIGQFVKLLGALLMAVPPLLPPLVTLAATVLPLLTAAAKLTLEILTGLLNFLADHASRASEATTAGFKTLASVFMTRVLPALREVAGWAQDNLIPALRDLGKWVAEYVWPALVKFGHALAGGVLIAVRMVSEAVADHRQELTTLAHAFAVLATFIVSRVIPVIGTLLKAQLVVVGAAFAAVITVIAFLVRAFQTVIRWAGNVAGALRTVGRAAGDAWAWVKRAFDAMVGFVAGLPGRIANVTGGMWNGIKDAFRGAINWIIGAWNGLQFTLPSVTLPFPPHTTFGGATFRVPQMNYVATGGIRSGFAVVGEAGRELVRLPAGSSVRSAPDTARDLAAMAGGGRLVVEWVGAPTDGLEREVFEWLRGAIRFKSGGNVQAALGR